MTGAERSPDGEPQLPHGQRVADRLATPGGPGEGCRPAPTARAAGDRTSDRVGDRADGRRPPVRQQAAGGQAVIAGHAAGSPQPGPPRRRAAFFDVDKTLLPGSSMYLLARGMYRRGL
jgi:hypothetical protein